VLVVDDVDVNRDVVAELLGRVGFDVATAGSVAEADANIEQSEFCLVLTDVVMPGSDGLEWIRRLRASARHRSLPVIAMSASSFQADIEKGLAAGADAFVGKPIDFERLFVEIAGVLGLRWRYQASADGAADCPPCDLERLLQDRLPTPGGRQMDELHCLARMGDMRGARRWAEATAASNARFAPFAATVVALAQAYRSKQLLAFVERHLGPRGES
jgi:CheY-like chemotaxis protein